MNYRPYLSILFFFSALSLLSLLSGCRSSRGSAAGDSSGHLSVAPVSGASADRQSPQDQVEALLGSYRQWSDVSMNVKCSLRAPKSITLSGKATMIYGKEIRISFRMLGFEVGGLYADTDSIFFYEKLNRTMVVESMSRLSAASGLQLADIQDILLSRITYPGAGDSDRGLAKKFRISDDADGIMLRPRSSALPWHYIISPQPALALSALSITLPGKGEALCSYNLPLATDAGPVSPSADIFARYGKQTVDASFFWSIETASWNQGLAPKRNLPKGYRRIPFAALIKSLGAKQ